MRSERRQNDTPTTSDQERIEPTASSLRLIISIPDKLRPYRHVARFQSATSAAVVNGDADYLFFGFFFSLFVLCSLFAIFSSFQ